MTSLVQLVVCKNVIEYIVIVNISGVMQSKKVSEFVKHDLIVYSFLRKVIIV